MGNDSLSNSSMSDETERKASRHVTPALRSAPPREHPRVLCRQPRLAHGLGGAPSTSAGAPRHTASSGAAQPGQAPLTDGRATRGTAGGRSREKGPEEEGLSFGRTKTPTAGYGAASPACAPLGFEPVAASSPCGTAEPCVACRRDPETV